MKCFPLRELILLTQHPLLYLSLVVYFIFDKVNNSVAAAAAQSPQFKVQW